MARSVVLMDLIRHRMPGSVSLFILGFRGNPAYRHLRRSWAARRAPEEVWRSRGRRLPRSAAGSTEPYDW